MKEERATRGSRREGRKEEVYRRKKKERDEMRDRMGERRRSEQELIQKLYYFHQKRNYPHCINKNVAHV